jgi:hypothetical protein
MRKNIPLIISALDTPCKRLLHLVKSSRLGQNINCFPFPKRYDYVLTDTSAKTGVCNILLVYGPPTSDAGLGVIFRVANLASPLF